MADKHIARQANKQKYYHRNKNGERQTKKANINMESRQTKIWTDGHTNRQTKIWTESQTNMYCHANIKLWPNNPKTKDRLTNIMETQNKMLTNKYKI